MRTCVVTKEKYPKKELIRVVRDNTGKVTVDKTGKQNGRGAYLKKDLEEVNKSDEKYNIENGNFEIYGNTVTSLRMRNRKKNGQIISHLNSVKQPLLQSTFQSIPIRQSCSQEMIWVETRCL